MPDLFAHFASGYLLSYSSKFRRYTALFVLGTVLPDVLTRIPEIVLQRFLGFPVFHFFNALHTPVGVTFASYILSYAFPEEERKFVFTWLLSGSLIHIALDLLQKQFYRAVYMPFFPFSTEPVQWGLYHYNASLIFFLPLLIITSYLWRLQKK